MKYSKWFEIGWQRPLLLSAVMVCAAGCTTTKNPVVHHWMSADAAGGAGITGAAEPETRVIPGHIINASPPGR